MKIFVNSQEEKDNLIKQSKYIHNFLVIRNEEYIGLDSDKAGILMHLYLNPDMIVVQKINEVATIKWEEKEIKWLDKILKNQPKLDKLFSVFGIPPHKLTPKNKLNNISEPFTGHTINELKKRTINRLVKNKKI